MTAQNDLDRTLGAWFHGDATTTPPPDTLARAIEATRHLRPRPALVARIGSSWIGSGENGVLSGIPGLRPALLVALVSLLALAIAGGAVLVGSRLLPHPPTSHVYLNEIMSAPDLPRPVGTPIVTTLLDGRVLVIPSYMPEVALLYDPSSGVSVPAGPMVSSDVVFGPAVRLRDGRVFVAGDRLSELFDPTTRQFTSVGPMLTARSLPGPALLPDGRVLVAGGVQPDDLNREIRTAELFDPATLSFSPTGPMSFQGGDMGTLPDGRIFFASSPNTEVYDPRSGTFAFAGVIPGTAGAAALADGRVVVVGPTGGLTGDDGSIGIWDPTRQTYEPINSLQHSLYSATLLDNGRVLVTGGKRAAWAGVFDPATEQVIEINAPATSRPTVTRLLDGRVLLLGGFDRGTESTVQVFR